MEALEYSEVPPDETSFYDETYDDQPNEMTRGRRIARYLANRFACYDPSRKKEGNLKLDAAWAYFEHSALPRHYLEGAGNRSISKKTKNFKKRKTEDMLMKAQQGEIDEKTKLYGVCSTPEVELGEFGLGIGIYFWTLRMLAGICLIAGCISLRNMLYYDSNEYDSTDRSELSYGVRTSAICQDTEWVYCPDCNTHKWDSSSGGLSRYGENEDGTMFFVLHNKCELDDKHSIYSFAALVFVVFSIITMNLVSRRREVQLDEADQTTQDYSIQITGPPPDAKDPEEWRAFFSQKFGGSSEAEVAAVTIAVDNEKLVRALLERRRALRNIKELLKPGVSFDPKLLDSMVDQCVKPEKAQKYLQTVQKLEEEVMELGQQTKGASHVFVTFQTEHSQRKVLEALSTSGYQKVFGSSSFPENYKFRGKHILQITEPSEPSTIIWHNLDNTALQLTLQVMASFTILAASVVGAYYLIEYVTQNSSTIWATVTITAINQVIPMICKWSSFLETHQSADTLQAALYVKMTLYKWINTAALTYMITPYIATLDSESEALTKKVYTIFFAELITNPALLLFDIWGQLQRHCFGPRANNQESMNLKFSGATFSLALRYTEITKIIFLTIFYSYIFPGGYFFAGASLILNYFVDKYCMLRTYGGVPRIGNTIAQFSRSYIFPLALAIFSVMSFIGEDGYPYDNVRPVNKTIVPQNVTFYVKGDSSRPEEVEIDKEYEYFQQSRPFNELKSFDHSFLGWAAIVVLCITVFTFLRKFYLQTLHKFFAKHYKAVGKESNDRFLDFVEHIGYIPSVRESDFEYPLLACDISDVDEGYLYWSDPTMDYPYNEQNLIYDLKLPDEHQHFSIIKTWNDGGVTASCDADDNFGNVGITASCDSVGITASHDEVGVTISDDLVGTEKIA